MLPLIATIKSVLWFETIEAEKIVVCMCEAGCISVENNFMTAAISGWSGVTCCLKTFTVRVCLWTQWSCLHMFYNTMFTFSCFVQHSVHVCIYFTTMFNFQCCTTQGSCFHKLYSIVCMYSCFVQHRVRVFMLYNIVFMSLVYTTMFTFVCFTALCGSFQ